MAVKYLLIFGIGHLLGDFYFQNEKDIKCKRENYKDILFSSLKYYFGVLLAVLPVCSLDMLLAATYMALLHLAIDIINYRLMMRKKILNERNIFVVSQCTRVVSFFILIYVIEQRGFLIGHIGIIDSLLNAYGYDAEKLARWTLSILFIHTPVNIFIQNFLEDYKPKGDKAIIKADNKAGRRIGTIERLIMFAFLAVDQYAAIGFILTAKSIARYDKITKDEKFSEYYLLGTLVSTLCVIVCRILILN